MSEIEINFNHVNAEDLNKMTDQFEAEKAEQVQQQITSYVQEVKEKLAALGIVGKDYNKFVAKLGKAKVKAKKAKGNKVHGNTGRNRVSKQTYTHPETGAFYKGSGRRPQWFLDYVANGGSVEDLKTKV